MTETVDELEILVRQLRQVAAQDVAEDLRGQLEKNHGNVSYTLRWEAQALMVREAEAVHCRQVVAVLDNPNVVARCGGFVAVIREWVDELVEACVSYCDHPAASTSAVSNLAELATATAAARLLRGYWVQPALRRLEAEEGGGAAE